MFFHLFVFTLAAANAELHHWDTTNCRVINESCAPRHKLPRECEYICDGITCEINIAIILPSDDYYIVNQNRSVEQLEKAIDYAANANIIPKNLKFNKMLFDDKCDQAYATTATIDAYSEFCAHVIFGPICDYCLASTGRPVKFLNSYGTPVITPGGFSFDFVLKKTDCSDEFFMLINTGAVDYQSLSEFFYLILMKYEWRKIALLYEKYDQNEVGGEQGCQLLMKSLMEIISNGITGFQHFDGDISLLNITYEEYLRRDVGVKYGIIPICASNTNTRKILLEAEKIKMTEKGEYTFFSFDLYNNAPVPAKPWLDPQDTDENNELARRAFRSLFIFTPWIEAEYAERNETVDDRRGMIYLDGIYDGMVLYSHALNNLVFKNNTDTTLVPRGTVVRGVDVISQMFGYTFQGKREQIAINCNGQRVSKYAMMQMNNEDSFHIVAEYSTLDKKIKMRRNVTWVSGQKPDDTPRCGYDNSKCPTLSKLQHTLIIVTVVIIIFICVISFALYRQRLLSNEIESWRINRDELIEKTPHYLTQSKTSIYSDYFEDETIVLMEHNKEIYGAKELNEHIKLEFNRKQLKELRTMKNISNNNLAKFHGICIAAPNSFILTEYCSRGSLQDVLKKFNFSSTLSLTLAKSLITDLIFGMHFLHSSEIRYHGSLKSSKCLVDSRFVLKVSDFGLRSIRYYDKGVLQKADGLLWSAPEVLRNNHQLEVSGLQKADVYSFAIIFHEILVTKGTFHLGEKKIEPMEIAVAIYSLPTFQR